MLDMMSIAIGNANKGKPRVSTPTTAEERLTIKGEAVEIELYRLNGFLNRLRPDGDCIVLATRRSTLKDGKYFSFAVSGSGSKKKGHLLAHRFAWLFFVGDIPDKLVVDHICRNRRCVNIDHLRLATQRQNILCGVGATAKNFQKTHCVNGHEYTADNTRIDNGARRCRICANAACRGRNRRRKALRDSKKTEASLREIGTQA